MKLISIKIVRFVMTILILNYGLIHPTLSEENDNALKVNPINTKKNKKAIEISFGSFHPGPYAPYQMSKKKWNDCNSMNLCNLNKLFGNAVGVKYIKRYYKNMNHNLDIDTSLTFGNQDYKSKSQDFIMFSIVPTYRYKISRIVRNPTIGIGAGLNLANNEIPSESKGNENLNTQFNIELGFEFNKKDKSEIILALNHRCTLFGAIGGKYSSSQWYTFGLRKWL